MALAYLEDICESYVSLMVLVDVLSKLLANQGQVFFPPLRSDLCVSLCPCLSLAQWSHYSWVSLVSALLFLFRYCCILLLSFACASLPPLTGVLDHSGGHWTLLSEAVPQPQVSWSSQFPEASVVTGTEKKLDWWTGAEAVCGRRGGVGCEGLGGRLRSWKGQPGKIQLHEARLRALSL